MRYFSFLIIVLLFACQSGYKAFVTDYHFTPQQQLPDYSSYNYWAAHPWKKDPADSIPAFLKTEKHDSLIDVFFIHPTTYTGNKAGNNASINDAELAAKTDYSTILYQASVFNQHARIFSPRYRQMHLSQFYIPEADSRESFDTAYADIKKAFLFYLAHYHNNRPIIIAGHSQGALIAKQLLKDFFDGKALQKKLVAAYLIGWPVPQNFYAGIPACVRPADVGCVCSWRTLRKGYVTEFVKKETYRAIVTNPLSWLISNEYVSKEMNKGGVMRNFNEPVPQVSDAQIQGNVLWINKPMFRGSFFFRTKNYHIADVNLFYRNIRENVAQRIQRFLR